MNKKNIILIIVLLAAVGVLLISRSCESVEKRFEIFPFKAADVGRIEIKDPNNIINLAHIDNVWMVEHPIKTQAKESQVTRFFESFMTLTASTTFQSEAVSRREFYNVDSTGVQVTLYDKTNK
ncbi:MAG: hypothetical protein FWG20_04090, partial [Candidatus Cloacimonetes bacterium]|nr:hypothetical protein [Candidatus Cloacimonadota bacterium]